MNITALFIALAGAIVLWFFLMRRLRTKPWMEKGPIDAQDGAAEGSAQSKVSMNGSGAERTMKR